MECECFCPSCEALLEDPRSLSCGHAFCNKCANSIVHNHKGICNLCGVVTEAISNTSQLALSVKHVQLIKAYGKDKEHSHPPVVTCSVEDCPHPAEYRCANVECGLLCAECFAPHLTIPVLRRHKVAKIAQEIVRFPVEFSKACTKHNATPYASFCPADKENPFHCSKCESDDASAHGHREHRPYSEAVVSLRDEILSLELKLKAKHTELDGVLRRVEKMKNSEEAHIRELTKSVKEHFDSIRKAVDKIEKECTDKISAHATATMRNIDDKLADIQMTEHVLNYVGKYAAGAVSVLDSTASPAKLPSAHTLLNHALTTPTPAVVASIPSFTLQLPAFSLASEDSPTTLGAHRADSETSLSSTSSENPKVGALSASKEISKSPHTTEKSTELHELRKELSMLKRTSSGLPKSLSNESLKHSLGGSSGSLSKLPLDYSSSFAKLPTNLSGSFSKLPLDGVAEEPSKPPLTSAASTSNLPPPLMKAKTTNDISLAARHLSAKTQPSESSKEQEIDAIVHDQLLKPEVEVLKETIAIITHPFYPIIRDVKLFDDEQCLRIVGSAGHGDDQFLEPTGITIDPADGRVFVADTGNHRIQIYSSTLEYLGTFGKKGDGAGEFNGPRGITFSNCGDVLVVVDHGNSRVQIFDRELKLIRIVGKEGTSHGEFRWPQFIAFDKFDSFYVADDGNRRIQKFTKDGDFVRTIGDRGSKLWLGASGVCGLTVNDANEILALAFHASIVRVYSTEGKHLRDINIEQVGKFMNYLARGPNGGFVVSDNAAHQITFYSATGDSYKELHNNCSIGTVFGTNGQFYAVNNNSHVIEY